MTFVLPTFSFFFSFVMMPLEYILVVITNSYHSKKQKQKHRHIFQKGGLCTGFTVMVKIDLRDSVSEFL